MFHTQRGQRGGQRGGGRGERRGGRRQAQALAQRVDDDRQVAWLEVVEHALGRALGISTGDTSACS
jgi:hypothetical protein